MQLIDQRAAKVIDEAQVDDRAHVPHQRDGIIRHMRHNQRDLAAAVQPADFAQNPVVHAEDDALIEEIRLLQRLDNALRQRRHILVHQQLAALDLQQHRHAVRFTPGQRLFQRVDLKRRFQLGDRVIADMPMQRRALFQRHIVEDHGLPVARELHVDLDVIHAQAQHLGEIGRGIFARGGCVAAMAADPQAVVFPAMNGFKGIHAHFSRAMLTPLSVSKML